MLAQRKRLLGAGPKSDVVPVHIGNRRMGLHRKVLHPRKSKRVFKNMIRLLETLFDVALAVAKAVTEIAPCEFYRCFIALPHHFPAAGR